VRTSSLASDFPTTALSNPAAASAIQPSLTHSKRADRIESPYALADARCRPGVFAWRLRGSTGALIGGLGFILPGLVMAAGGIPAALLAALVAFAPSFSFILFGAARFERLLVNERVVAFLAGAAPAAAGAIIGSSIPLAAVISQTWQHALLTAAAFALLVLRRSVVLTLLAAGTVGAVAGLLGAPLPH
jgi:chromate transport protein ChrA